MHLRSGLKRGPVGEETCHRRMKGEGFGGHSLFKGTLNGGNKSYPSAKTAGEPSVREKPRARFIPAFLHCERPGR